MKSKLFGGNIAAGMACPWAKQCGMMTCPKQEKTDHSFSCAMARAFDMFKPTDEEQCKSKTA